MTRASANWGIDRCAVCVAHPTELAGLLCSVYRTWTRDCGLGRLVHLVGAPAALWVSGTGRPTIRPNYEMLFRFCAVCIGGASLPKRSDNGTALWTSVRRTDYACAWPTTGRSMGAKDGAMFEWCRSVRKWSFETYFKRSVRTFIGSVRNSPIIKWLDSTKYNKDVKVKELSQHKIGLYVNKNKMDIYNT